MIRFSFANLAAGASIAASTTFTDTDHPAANALDALRPFVRAYSPDLSTHRLTIDFGVATTITALALLHVNHAAIVVQANATDTWGAPSYSLVTAINRSPNDRYNYGYSPNVAGVPISYRYLSLLFPTGTPTDGSTKWKIGALFAGLLMSAPRGILTESEEEKVEARQDITTDDGRVLQRLIRDEPAYRVRADRVAASDTELAAWQAIDTAWSAAPAQAALVLLHEAYPAEVFVMRQTAAPKWSRSLPSRSEMELEEVRSA